MSGGLGVSLVTILVATLASWIFGAVFYGTLAKQWMAAAGLTEDDVKGPNGRPSPVPYVISIILEFVIAYCFAMLLIHIAKDGFTTMQAVYGAILVWFGFIFTTQCINHRYSMKPWSLTLIDSAHWLGVLVVQAIVIGLMGL